MPSSRSKSHRETSDSERRERRKSSKRRKSSNVRRSLARTSVKSERRLHKRSKDSDSDLYKLFPDVVVDAGESVVHGFQLGIRKAGANKDLLYAGGITAAGFAICTIAMVYLVISPSSPVPFPTVAGVHALPPVPKLAKISGNAFASVKPVAFIVGGDTVTTKSYKYAVSLQCNGRHFW